MPYVITVVVMPDDPADNSGLAFGSVDLLTDFGLAQQAADAINPVLGTFPWLGTPQDDDLSGISGSQNTTNLAQAVVFARGTANWLATGTLQAPQTEGTYTVSLGNAAAYVLDASKELLVQLGAEDVLLGAGFTVVVAAPPDPPVTPEPPTTPDPPATTGGGPCGAGIGGFMAFSLLGLCGLHSSRRWRVG